MPLPEPSPEEKIYRRVLVVARLDGWNVVIVAAIGTLVTVFLGDFVGTGIGLLIAGAGVMELHGHRRLLRRDASGMRWLVRAQLFLLSLILVYCVSRLGSFDGEGAMGNITPDMAQALQEAGVSMSDILPMVRSAFFLTYTTVAAVSLLYQGGMALYYRRRIARVTAFLTAPPTITASAPLP